eukprot:COSAG04_NODE_6182_length_1391_cov_1.240712_1_plen_105_part_00
MVVKEIVAAIYPGCGAYVFPSTTTPDAEVSKSMAQPSGPPSYSPRRLKSLLTIFDVPSTLPRMISVVPSAHAAAEPLMVRRGGGGGAFRKPKPGGREMPVFSGP